jgi:hypothetical protein
MTTKITPIGAGLGYVVLYGAASTLHVTFYRAQKCMLKHSLNDEYLNPPTARRAFGRSIKDTEKKGKKDTKKKDEDKFAREAKVTPGKRAAVIFSEHQVPDTLNFDFKPETMAEFDTASGRLVASGRDKKFVEKQFAHHTKNLIGDDLRNMARRVVEAMDGVSLRGNANVRDTGGIYFVPRTYANKLEALANVLEELKIGYLKTFGVVKGRIERESLFASSTTHVENELADIRTALKNLTSRVSSARQHRRRLEKLTRLLAEYAKLTDMEKAAESLQLKIDAATRAADKKIAQLTPKKAERNRPRKSAK